ncbi:rhomboid family intramembrane serine protease [Streptacidiphilus sp. N1-12]|uniref:Rhomboid family intramembrane serine protease n=2 Tax=Streptacidiphilus alkalitolerans TaxID=3342712 RepID=A0ABV6V9C5_9ACTN
MIDTLPDCYRHPGRETGVSCNRCERPVCPECRVEAAVGFQCRECVRGAGPAGGGPAQRVARTEFGGGLVADGRLVTKVLIGLNAAVWLLHYVMSPASVLDLYMWGPGVANGQWYRMFTAVFFHTAPWHIALNMWSLWVLGPPLERLLGRWRFLALYLVSGLAGSALVLLADPYTPTLGASGAIFGLLGALLVIQRKRGYELGPIMAIVVVNLVATFAIPGISWEGHVGGLAAGLLLGFGLAHAPLRNRTLVQAGSVVLVLVAVLVVSLLGVAGLN